jgi:excisionase family DNA binding protein
MPTATAPSFTLSERELAKFLGVSVELVRVLRRQGRLPFVKVNTRILYLRDDAEAFLEQNRQAAVGVGA